MEHASRGTARFVGIRLRVVAAAVMCLGVFALGTTLAEAAVAPPGYQLVQKAFSAPQSSFTTLDSVSCPAGTVTWGGGNYLSAWSPPVYLASSYWNGATPGAWVVAEGNTNPFTASFGVMALCAKKPTGYKLVTSTVTIHPFQVNGGTDTCPTGKVLLSGGFASTSDKTTVRAESAAPIPGNAAFQAFEVNTTQTDQTFHVYALCAAKPAGYTRKSTSTTVAPGAQVRITTNCPANTAVIGGGIRVNPLADFGTVSAEESHPDFNSKGWVVMLDNTGTTAETLSASAICAA